MDKTTVICITEEEISDFKKTMKLFENVPAIPGILKIHTVRYDPSTALFSVQKHALDLQIDDNIEVQATK